VFGLAGSPREVCSSALFGFSFAGWRLSGGFVEWYPAFGPIPDFAKGVLEFTPFLGQLVLDANGGLGHDMSRNQILAFEGAKPFRKHAVGDIGNGGFDQSVSGPATEEKLENGPGPAATDELDGTMEAGTDLLGLSVGHETKRL